MPYSLIIRTSNRGCIDTQAAVVGPRAEVSLNGRALRLALFPRRDILEETSGNNLPDAVCVHVLRGGSPNGHGGPPWLWPGEALYTPLGRPDKTRRAAARMAATPRLRRTSAGSTTLPSLWRRSKPP